MATKTFKIGEYAKGGIIKVETNNKHINIRIIDMFNIYNELEHHQITIQEYSFINPTEIERKVSNILHEITTSYYTEKIMKWIKEKTGLSFMWC